MKITEDNNQISSTCCPQMSLGKSLGRNMRLSLDTVGSSNGKDVKTSRKHSPKVNIPPERILKCYSDENRNSLIEPNVPIVQVDLCPTSVCEVTTTEITEQKTKKKSIAMNTFRNLVRATVVSNPVKSLSSHHSPDDQLHDNGNKEEKVPRKKKTSLTKYKIRKRTRRTKDIYNEGASLWKSMVMFFLRFNISFYNMTYVI